ncbi:calcium-binding protein [Acinetobacter sp. VNH17]|uniref:Calcium-binding protein n=1 Tax=Acinetobacter thutiue TaxID=2998078 RepID=A0ABT7WQT4_9GAMM|nr:calcium-binding protein [Acinetobacter thutiue]MDN0015033.1 calcium-binding protein [Acinetobacter thutiue]
MSSKQADDSYYGNIGLNKIRVIDKLYGGSNNDILYGGIGADELYGGDGSDIMYANKKTENNKLDLLDNSSNRLVGGDGGDILIGGKGNDILIAGEIEFDDSDKYSNILFGGLGADTLYGAAGDDVLYAVDGMNNELDLEENILYGGGGNDTLYGSHGNDIIYTGSTDPNKTFFGFPDGDDIGTKNTAHGYAGDDQLFGEDGEDTLFGGQDNDELYGNRGNDVLFGGEGDDKLYGGDDHDVLAGGTGNDTLSGGKGGDVLMGDIGYDTYNYTVGENKISQGWSWVDHIYDLDGVGEIRMDTMFTLMGQQFLADSYKLQVGQKVGYNTWLSTNQQYTITRYEKTRLVLDYEGSDETFKDLYNPLQNDSRQYHLIIQSANHFEHQYHVWFWKSGDLGLVIPNQPAPPAPQPPTPRVPNPPPPPRDPLSLDLDNDGKISTLSKNPGVYFDLDNSNFAEKTSWIAPQDGLLVLDRNGNGKIDGGAELFGTETFLADGSLAGNGYIALQELDDNHDGEISEADEIYHQLRVWQDINSNGVSESNELKSLQELNIKSINLNYESHSTVDENNVEHRENSIFTYLDETTGITNTLWFDTDRQDSVPVVIHNGAEIPIDEDIQLLPELAGFGNVYSLHHAMQLDTTGKLKELVKEFVAQFEDNQARLDLVEQIILQWTGVTQIQSDSLGVNINAQHVRALEKLLGNQAAATVSQAEFVGIEQVYQQNFKYVYTMLMQQSHSAHLFYKIEFIDQGNGQWTADFTKLNQYIINTVTMESISENTLKFVKDMYPILEGIDPYNSKIFNTFKQTLDQALESNLSQEDYDLVKKYLNTNENIFGTTEADEISITESKANSPIFLLDGDDILNGGQGKDLVYGNKGNDQLLGLGGHDELYGGEGDDGLYGGTGEDILYGDSGNDRLEGGADIDQLYGGAGNDILIGGADGDYLYGGIGNDTYIFAANFGHDIINNHDATQDRQDIIQFTDSFVQSDFTYRRNNDDLIISTLDSANSIRVQSYFQSDALGQYRVDQIQFSDGVILDIEAVKALVLIGTEKADILRAYTTGNTISGEAGDDVIHGNIGADQLYGGDGLDRLYGGDGNDELRGGIGDDILEGGAGDDILEGGQGSDLLQGGSGDDIYVLNVDSGQDTIIDGNGSNLIKLNNILQEEILIDFAPDNKNDIQINYGLDNKLIIKNFFNSNFSLEFDNGTIWNKYEIASKIIVELMGTNQIDQLHGHAYISDHIQGLEGNDVIYAYAGNDTLNGGTGNDYLEGGTGNDTYIFAANFGHDIINNYDSGQNRQDIIQFTEGLIQSDFTFRRNNDDLVIRTLNGENSITVQNYFQSDALGYYRIDQIQFSDSTTLNVETVKTLVLLGTAEADVLRAYTTGNDTVLFKNGITFSQVGNYLTKSGDDLILKVNGSNTNKVTIKNFFKAGQYLVETLQFETGGQLTAEQIFGAFGLTIPSGTAPTPPNPVGDTTYNYSSGELTITEQSGNDKVIFKNGISFSQVGNYLSKSGDDLILKVNGSSTNKVTVKNFFLAGNYLVENFEFETGGNLTAEQVFGAFGLTLPSTGSGNQGSSEVAGDTVYNYTTGALTITEHSGNDKVIFKNGITFNQVGSYLTKSGDDLILKVNGSNSNKVTVKDFFLGGAHEVESFNFETGGSISSQQIYQVFGVDRPVNAEDEVTSIVMGDSGDNVLSSDAAVSELFILNEGNDILELLLNASGETAVDYVTDFDMAEDQIDLSQILDSHATSSNLSSYIEIIYDTDAKTNTLSVRGQSNQAYKDVLVMTNQSEQLYLQDLINNQSLIY